jgi:hypothetical protein
MKLYIGGKITGDKNYQEKFADAEKCLIDAGYEVVNPAKLCGTDTRWFAAMRICVKAMMDCEGVAMLDDWDESKGAKIECFLALDVGMKLRSLESWIEHSAAELGEE